MMSSGKRSHPGFSKQPPDQSGDDQGAPSRPYSLPLGYYDYYGIPLPKGAVQAKRSLYPGRPLPSGYLEYYGIIPASKPAETSESPAKQEVQAQHESPTATPEVSVDVPASFTSGESPVQAKSNGWLAQSEAELIHAAAVQGTSGPSGPLPYLDEIQKSFGSHDVTGIKAHTDSRAVLGAQAMGAEAFATGAQVAFAGTPSLHTAAHEATHVIQQPFRRPAQGGRR